MAKDTPGGKGKEQENGEQQKYGRSNLRITQDGDDMILRFSLSGTVHKLDGTPCLAGMPNPSKEDPERIRAFNLVATSNGYKEVGPVKVSLNVTAAPAVEVERE